MRHGLIARQTKQHEIIHVAAIPAHAQHALNVVVQRVEVDQCIQLTEQVADRDAARLAVVGE